MTDVLLHQELRACGWWTLTRQKIAKSRADYWVFVLLGFANRSTDFIVIKPADLLKRFDAIHGKSVDKFQCYFWVIVPPHKRESLLKQFTGEQHPEVSEIICTNAFGMGLDVPNVRLVIHYQHPASVED